MIQVLLAEDHNLVRSGIKMLLQSDEDINIIGEAKNGREALEQIDSGLKVDVVLADINMPEIDGMMLLRELRNNASDVRVVMLSMHDNEKYIHDAFLEGASGYLLKNVSADEMIFSVKHVHSGNKYLCSELSMGLLEKQIRERSRILEDEVPMVDFSMREIEVLHLIAEGLTNLEIADKIFISKRTVEGHRQSLLEKTGSKNTAALIRYAVINGVVR